MDSQSARALAFLKPQLNPRSRGDCALSPAGLPKQMARVARTHGMGTNPLQTGRSLATASSRPLALRDHPLSFLPQYRREDFPLFSLLSDSLSGQEGLPGTFPQQGLSQRKCPSSLRPPQPHVPAGAPLPPAAEEGQRQGGFWSSSLSPPSSLTETAGLQLRLGIPLSGKKNPFLIAGTQISPRGGWVMETKCRRSDMSPHQKKITRAKKDLGVGLPASGSSKAEGNILVA